MAKMDPIITGTNGEDETSVSLAQLEKGESFALTTQQIADFAEQIDEREPAIDLLIRYEELKKSQKYFSARQLQSLIVKRMTLECKREQINTLINQTKKQIEELGDKVSAEEKTKLDELLTKLEEATKTQDYATMKELTKNIKNRMIELAQ
tara:strand:- start:135 stop:587 length:453 start_codon:yes stop_codon:yes gene_type:complete